MTARARVRLRARAILVTSDVNSGFCCVRFGSVRFGSVRDDGERGDAADEGREVSDGK